MSDLSQMSDEELLSQLSDDELKAMAGGMGIESAPAQQQESQSPLSRMPIMSALGAISSAIDPYTGAPTRAGISAGLKGENPLEAAWQQFGMPSETAPTGEDISKQIGVPESVAPYTGMAVDVLADPTNLIPGKAIPSSLGAVGRGTKAVAGRVGPKVAEAFTGIPKKEIKTFINDYDRVSNLIKKFKDAPDEASDIIREGYQNKLQSFRRGANRELETILNSEAGSKRVKINDVLSAIDAKLKKLNPNLYGDDIAEMQDVQRRVLSLSDDVGTVSVKDMNDIKQYLDGLASPEWSAMGTRIFKKGDKVAQASQQAANVARKAVNKAAPEIKEVNQKLSALRKVEEKLNKNLITAGKSQSALKAAGSGANTRARRQLEKLGEITGRDFISDADALAAFERFKDTQLLPIDTTGKSATRIGLGGMLGYAAGGMPGAVIGGAITSPEVLKRAIQAYKVGIEPAAEFGAKATTPLVRGLSVGRGVGVNENARKKRLKALGE